MNMLSLEERLNIVVMLFCSAFVCMCGGAEDVFAACEAALIVRRGTTRRAVPQQTVTVSCTLKHCGQPLNITWCKILEPDHCERINESENVGITQKHISEDQLIFFLSFTKVSVHEDGLYRCELTGLVSHAINISVSDLNQGVEDSDDYAAESLKTDHNGVRLWLPYLAIFFSIALPVVLLTVLTLQTFRCRHYTETHNCSKRQDPFTHGTAELAECSVPSPPRPAVVSVAETPRPHPTLTPAGTQPAAANAAHGSQVSCSPLYAVINHRKPGNQTSGRHATAKPEGEYAAIIFP